jgi:C-terminal peptidase prc
VYSPTQAAAFHAVMDGREPYGLSFSTLYGLTRLRITDVTTGGAAYEHGLAVGDIVVAVNDREVYAPDRVEAILMQHADKPVVVRIRRAGNEYDVLIDPRGRRARRVSGMICDTTAYINIDCFAEGSAREFTRLMCAYRNQGARRYVVDLRGNPGGWISECASMCKLFSNAGDTLVIFINAQGVKRVIRADTTGALAGEMIDVMVDHNSASASEAFCLIGQDNGFARVYGETTEGKGRSTHFETLSDGRVLGVSTERYVSRMGRSIDYEFGSNGVQPDVEQYWMRPMRRWIGVPDSEMPITPRAMRELRARCPEPTTHIVDSLMRAHKVHHDEDDRNYYATAIWGRLGMAIEVQQQTTSTRNEAGDRPRPRRKGTR